jgi:hypothetical protein
MIELRPPNFTTIYPQRLDVIEVQLLPRVAAHHGQSLPYILALNPLLAFSSPPTQSTPLQRIKY